jgi:hypothetical protein
VRIKTIAVAVLVVGSVTRAKDADPSQFTQTVMVVSATVKIEDTGAMVRNTRPSLISGGGVRIRSTTASYADVIFTNGKSQTYHMYSH